MALWKRNVILSIFVIVLAVLPLVMLKDAEFSGADSLAETSISEINPDYKPWFSSIYEPESGEIESLLFAVQAAIGAGVVGFVLGRITSKKGE